MTTEKLVRDHLDQLARTVRTTPPPLSVIVAHADDAVSSRRSRARHRRKTAGFSAGRTSRVTVIAVAGAVAAAAAVTLVYVDRGHAPSRPAQAPTTTTSATVETPTGVVAYPDAWVAVQLTSGLVPWYQLDAVAVEQFTASEIGPAAMNPYCEDWTTVSPDAVICNAVHIEGLLPAVTYQDDAAGRSVEVSTIHSDMTAVEYAIMFSAGKDTGYDDPPLQPTPMEVGNRTGELIEPVPGEPHTTRRITLEMAPGVLVAVESMGFAVEELVGFAEQLTPASVDGPIPLLLASVTGDGLDVQLHGAVVDNEVCALSTHWVNAGSLDCTLLGDDDLLVVPEVSLPVYTGLVSGDVASISLTYSDGSQTDIAPVPQPVGQTQAFAAVSEHLPVVSIVAVDENGNELSRVELDPTDVVIPTTGIGPAPTATSAG